MDFGVNVLLGLKRISFYHKNRLQRFLGTHRLAEQVTVIVVKNLRK